MGAHIKRGEVSTTPYGYQLIGTSEDDKGNPQTVIDARFSAAYLVATVIVRRSVWVKNFTEDAIRRPEVRRLLQVTEVRSDPGLEANDAPSGARVTIRTKDGREHLRQEIIPKGHPKHPMSIGAVIDKFRKCLPLSARPFKGSAADEIIGMVSNLEYLDDVTKLFRPLVPWYLPSCEAVPD